MEGAVNGTMDEHGLKTAHMDTASQVQENPPTLTSHTARSVLQRCHPTTTSPNPTSTVQLSLEKRRRSTARPWKLFKALRYQGTSVRASDAYIYVYGEAGRELG